MKKGTQMNLDELYQDMILDHSKNPRNFRELPGATHSAQGYNPLCGDQITIWLLVDQDTIVDATFTGQGCAISQASASMMTQLIQGRSVTDAEELFQLFRAQLVPTNGTESDSQISDSEVEELGVLNSLLGVRQYPNRIKCATLAWHAMHSAMETKV